MGNISATELALSHIEAEFFNTFEKVLKNAPVDKIHVRSLGFKNGKERYGAFKVADMVALNTNLLKVCNDYNIEDTFETAQVLKPLCMHRRLKYGFCSPAEWLVISHLLPDEVVPTSGRHYQIYTLAATYDWVELWSIENRKKYLAPIATDIEGLVNRNMSVLL